MLSTSLYMKQDTLKPVFKEKFVELSEELFKGNSPFSSNPATFWDSYLILNVNKNCITQLVKNKSEEDLLDLKTTLTSLFRACLDHLNLVEADDVNDERRQFNSIELLTVLVRSLFSKKRLTHFNIISILSGLEKADLLFADLVKSIEALIKQKKNNNRSAALQLALVLSSGNDNVNQNGINGYFMTNNISKTLFDVLSEDDINENDARDTLMLLGMLSNYNKYEFKNPYMLYLGKTKQQKALETIIDLYTATFTKLTSRYIELNDDEETISKTMVTYMSRWFSASAPSPPSEAETAQALASLPSAQTALILPLYDLISTNNYFITTLIHKCTKTDDEEGGVNTKSNFFSAFLSFTSYLFQNNKSERTNIYSKISLLILLKMIEENSIINYMTRDTSKIYVRLCRQRSPPLPRIKQSRSLFCMFLDDMILYTKHNIRKKLDLVSYKLAFSIIYRILSFLNKHKIRLEYHWSELWPTLASISHFTALRIDDLQANETFNSYLSSFIGVMNICVTHGETFLNDTKSYDSLFYEIIRSTSDFITLSSYASKLTNAKGRSPTITVNEFSNIKLICNHFKPALDEWQTNHNIKFPTPEQVMSVINENYATLELTSIDTLNNIHLFNKMPNEMAFFRQVLRVVTVDYMEYFNVTE